MMGRNILSHRELAEKQSKNMSEIRELASVVRGDEKSRAVFKLLAIYNDLPPRHKWKSDIISMMG